MKHALAGIFAISALAIASPGFAADSLAIHSASLKGETMTLDLTAPKGGWAVIHEAQQNGSPGKHIGYAQIKAGENKNVQIKLDEPVKPGGDVVVMLHEDTGQAGTYEFKPGGNADKPVVENGKPVMKTIAPK